MLDPVASAPRDEVDHPSSASNLKAESETEAVKKPSTQQQVDDEDFDSYWKHPPEKLLYGSVIYPTQVPYV